MDRRPFLQTSGTLAAGLCGAPTEAASPDAGTAAASGSHADLARACEKARRLGIGRAVLEGPASAKVESYGTWTSVYTAGKAGVRPGGGIRIGVRHLVPARTKIQNTRPKEDGFVRLQAPDGVATKVAVECANWSKRFFNDYFPLQNIVEVIAGSPGLKAGQSIRATYGDTSGGSKGMRLQPFDEERFVFMTYVDATGEGEFTVLGAALLGGLGAGVFGSLEEGVEAMVHVADEIEPDPARHAIYEEMYEAYVQAYTGLAEGGAFDKLAAIQTRG